MKALSKREQIAAMAMAALIQNAPSGNLHNSKEGCELAIKWADDLIEELKNTKKE